MLGTGLRTPLDQHRCDISMFLNLEDQVWSEIQHQHPGFICEDPGSSLVGEVHAGHYERPGGEGWAHCRLEEHTQLTRMEGKLLTGGEDYEKEFNPKDYLTTYYSFDSGAMAEKEILKFNLEKLFQTFSKGGVGGDVLIDIGSGPTIYQLLSACEAFREIIATDFTPKNLQEVQKWLNNEPGAHDWSPATQYVCELEGDRSKWQEKEAKLRRTVTRVLKCDVNKLSPLGSAQVPPADCILTLLALECACPDVDAYRAALHNLAGLLKPGGYLVTTVTLHFQHYMVGSKKFSGLYLEKETVEKAIRDAGFQVLRCDCHSLSYTQTCCVNDGFCFVVAHKGPEA